MWDGRSSVTHKSNLWRLGNVGMQQGWVATKSNLWRSGNGAKGGPGWGDRVGAEGMFKAKDPPRSSASHSCLEEQVADRAICEGHVAENLMP